MTEKTETKTVIEVYDPAMCCSTGVCGPDVDDVLADFANDVKWLKSQDVEVQRFNLGQEPEAFKTNAEVLARLKNEGTAVLPIILVNGEMVSEGGYPDRNTLKNWTGLSSNNGEQKKEAQPVYNEKVELLVAIGSAVATGSEQMLKQLFTEGEQMGISKDDMARAMQTGLNMYQRPLSQIVHTANKLLGVSANGCAPGSGCC